MMFIGKSIMGKVLITNQISTMELCGSSGSMGKLSPNNGEACIKSEGGNKLFQYSLHYL